MNENIDTSISIDNRLEKFPYIVAVFDIARKSEALTGKRLNFFNNLFRRCLCKSESVGASDTFRTSCDDRNFSFKPPSKLPWNNLTANLIHTVIHTLEDKEKLENSMSFKTVDVFFFSIGAIVGNS